VDKKQGTAQAKNKFLTTKADFPAFLLLCQLCDKRHYRIAINGVLKPVYGILGSKFPSASRVTLHVCRFDP
jgi:hypothetical protein